MKENFYGGIGCSEVLESLSDYVDGELSAERRAQIDEHLQHCSNCAHFGMYFQTMVRSAPGSMESDGSFDAGVLERLHQALDSTED
ncbi:MAG: anti-sigma factor [Myxococcota bacterium]